jgi:hypothetical protein
MVRSNRKGRLNRASILKRLEVGQSEGVTRFTFTTKRSSQRLANKVKAELPKHEFPGVPGTLTGKLAETRTSLEDDGNVPSSKIK